MMLPSVFAGALIPAWLTVAPVAVPTAGPSGEGVAGDAPNVLAPLDGRDDPDARAPSPLRIELSDAIEAAMINNTQLQTSLLDAEAAWAGYGASWGAFDATFFSTLTKSETVNPPDPQNVVGGLNFGAAQASEFDLFSWRTGLRGQFETGTQWEIGVGPTFTRFTQRDSIIRDANGNPIIKPNGKAKTRDVRSDEYTADVTLSLTQPLLRGGADGYAKTGVELAVQDSNMAAVDSERVATETLESVITAYWNLIFAVQDVATRVLSVQLSEELLGITQRKYDQGLQNRLDVVEVEAELARRKEERLTAVQGHENAMDELRRLILAPEANDWDRPIEALTDWSTAVSNVSQRLGGEALDEESAVFTALSRRPDVRRSRMALERADIELRRAGTEALPRLDVTGSYGLLSNERRNTSNALDALDDTGFHEARLFLDFELPIGNRTAGYNEHRRRLERERALVSVRETEINAIADVRDALRQVDLQTERVRSAAETVRLRREVYEGERRRLENDLSTPYQVREFQRDLLEAIDNETRAQLDLAVAWTRLVASQGLLVGQTGYQLPVMEASPEEAPPAP